MVMIIHCLSSSVLFGAEAVIVSLAALRLRPVLAELVLPLIHCLGANCSTGTLLGRELSDGVRAMEAFPLKIR